MNSIIGFTDLISESELTEEQTDFLSMVWESAQNLLRIINDILDFSKIEAGEFEIEFEKCSLVKKRLITLPP